IGKKVKCCIHEDWVAAFIFVGMNHGFFLIFTIDLDLSVAFKKASSIKWFWKKNRYLYSFVIFSKIFIFVGMNHGFFLDLSVAFKKASSIKWFWKKNRYLYSFVIFSKIGSKSNKKDYPIIYLYAR
ncbi:hypothetical protein ACJX0J_025774, partial [Zea mays]